MARSAPSATQAAFMLSDADPRAAYRHLRNYLAGQAVGATRDRALLEELVKALFSKHFMDQQRAAPSPTASDTEVAGAYASALKAVAEHIPGVVPEPAVFTLDPSSLAFLHGCISSFDLDSTGTDALGDAFEVFTGAEARGQEGQFFTPQNAVGLLIDLTDPRPGERVIDPACGAGGFLSAVARRLISAGADPNLAAASVFGVDKDRYLASLASTRIAFLAFSSTNVYCADSLAWRTESGERPEVASLEGTFDVVLTNPPFGSRIVAASAAVQREFDLGWRWKLDGNQFAKTSRADTSVPPQVLFIERCVSLVRPGGRIGMVVPESLISGRNYRYVVAWIRSHADIKAVLGMPEALFKTSGKGGTHTKTCLLYLRKHEDTGTPRKTSRTVFMAEAKWCGNDSRGRKSLRDELPTIAERWHSYTRKTLREEDHLGYAVPAKALVDDILAPRYYNPEIAQELGSLKDTHDLISVGTLVDEGAIEITTGHEVGAVEYGSGTIPFVRTSDISNWEIKLDPKHGVSDEVYERFAPRQDVREGDLLMVRDGTYLVGTCAYVTKYDTRIVFQSHLFKLRVLKPERISPHLLLAALSSGPVRRQIKAKRFTQDIIDSLGNRVLELVLPLPRDPETRSRVESMVSRAIDERVEARELARQACFEIIGRPALAELDPEDGLPE